MRHRVRLATLALCCLPALVDRALPEEPVKPAPIDAPLPEGWPKPTSPGTIETKSYPAYRSAAAGMPGSGESSDGMLFWALFAHIKRKDIAMTAPVVSEYPEDGEASGRVSMEFLYRSTKQGELGGDGVIVEVVDHEPMTVVSLGVVGAMNDEIYWAGVERLEEWLADQAEWKAAGPPRRLGYHGPMTPVARRQWEVQIPVEKAVPPAGDA